MHSRTKIRKLEKQRLQAIKVWDVAKLDEIESELKILQDEDNDEINEILVSLCKEYKRQPTCLVDGKVLIVELI